MRTLHADLTADRWHAMSVAEQMGNIGTEVARAARARDAGDTDRLERSVARAMELFEITLRDPRWREPRRREIDLARDVVRDYLVGPNAYGSSAASLDAYFLPFADLARRGR